MADKDEGGSVALNRKEKHLASRRPTLMVRGDSAAQTHCHAHPSSSFTTTCTATITSTFTTKTTTTPPINYT
ncbi:hypothetical protein E2C01_000877 [Portunus trituberculatus]|uniref:Uncharacterized protein n=1 Tax=Portunus trituberculatus TaxID=210409 RepID=A0A5B7CIT5_PORTR|nr:hypothetical protein [Portunus trituberculatus]